MKTIGEPFFRFDQQRVVTGVPRPITGGIHREILRERLESLRQSPAETGVRRRKPGRDNGWIGNAVVQQRPERQILRIDLVDQVQAGRDVMRILA